MKTANDPHGFSRVSIGERFGRLTVESIYSENWKGYAVCRCDCGEVRRILRGALRNGQTKSCSCLQRDTLRKRATTHGDTNSPEHVAWRNIKQRCHDENCPDYKDYGAKGIRVCDRWMHDYSAFLSDMGRKPNRSYSIDRIDTKGNYEPGNCKWSTAIEQARNKTTNRVIEYMGRTQTLVEWVRELGLKYDRVKMRIYAGDSIEQAFNPLDMRKKCNR